MAYLDLSRAVRSVDSLLRLHQGIQEFTDDEECLLRISIVPAARAVSLSDGTLVQEGEPVLQLHLWNEHLPLMPDEGPSTAWANLMKRRMRASLATVAAHLDRERQYDGIRAIQGLPTFASRLGASQMVRTAQRFGFDVIEPTTPLELRERIYEIFNSMLLWGLTWAFNPAGLRSKGLLRHRYQIWISRDKFIERYASRQGRPGMAQRAASDASLEGVRS